MTEPGKGIGPDRRAVLAGIGAVALIGVGYAGFTHLGAVTAAGGATLTVAEAHRQALAGDILLIDIRRPDEWARTGVPQGAVPIDMRAGDFTDRLKLAAASAPGRPIALICARGVRSNRLARQLQASGFAALVDVPEGMLGSRAGDGWLAAGLPVTRP